MILDDHRLRLLLPGLSPDIQDTVENLLEQVRIDLEYEEELSQEIASLEKTIEELKKPMAPATSAKPGKYVASGNTYPVKDLFKAFGFRWDGDNKYWFLADLGTSTSEIVQKVREKLKEQDSTAEIIFVAGK